MSTSISTMTTSSRPQSPCRTPSLTFTSSAPNSLRPCPSLPRPPRCLTPYPHENLFPRSLNSSPLSSPAVSSEDLIDFTEQDDYFSVKPNLKLCLDAEGKSDGDVNGRWDCRMVNGQVEQIASQVDRQSHSPMTLPSPTKLVHKRDRSKRANTLPVGSTGHLIPPTLLMSPLQTSPTDCQFRILPLSPMRRSHHFQSQAPAPAAYSSRHSLHHSSAPTLSSPSLMIDEMAGMSLDGKIECTGRSESKRSRPEPLLIQNRSPNPDHGFDSTDDIVVVDLARSGMTSGGLRTAVPIAGPYVDDIDSGLDSAKSEGKGRRGICCSESVSSLKYSSGSVESRVNDDGDSLMSDQLSGGGGGSVPLPRTPGSLSEHTPLPIVSAKTAVPRVFSGHGKNVDLSTCRKTVG